MTETAISIEQNLRIKNFKASNGNFETKSGDKTAWTKNSWRLLAMGSQRQCSKGDHSFQSVMIRSKFSSDESPHFTIAIRS